MKSIRLLLLLASGVTTGAFAQSGGLTDMSQSRFAKMANTELGSYPSARPIGQMLP